MKCSGQPCAKMAAGSRGMQLSVMMTKGGDGSPKLQVREAPPPWPQKGLQAWWRLDFFLSRKQLHIVSWPWLCFVSVALGKRLRISTSLYFPLENTYPSLRWPQLESYFSFGFPQHSVLTWRDILTIYCNKNIALHLIISFILKSLDNKLEIYNKHTSVNGKNDSLHAIYLPRLFLPPDRAPFPLTTSFLSIIWVNSYSLETICIFIQPIQASSKEVNSLQTSKQTNSHIKTILKLQANRKLLKITWIMDLGECNSILIFWQRDNCSVIRRHKKSDNMQLH